MGSLVRRRLRGLSQTQRGAEDVLNVIRNYLPADHAPDGEKVELERPTPLVLTQIEERWAGSNPDRWAMLIQLMAYRHCGLTLDQIGLAFGHHKGTVLRRIAKCRSELREVLTLQKEE